jgi:hypothetical protein
MLKPQVFDRFVRADKTTDPESVDGLGGFNLVNQILF